jgi:hypothetical protein
MLVNWLFFDFSADAVMQAAVDPVFAEENRGMKLLFPTRVPFFCTPCF